MYVSNGLHTTSNLTSTTTSSILLKCQISACRKYTTTDSAQSHIYGQAYTVLHQTSHQQLQVVCYVYNEMHTTSNLSPHVSRCNYYFPLHTITAVGCISHHQDHITAQLLLLTQYYSSLGLYTTSLSLCHNATTTLHRTSL
jgi:hypothetical protein